MILFSKRTLLESKNINYLVRAMDQTCINQFHQWFASRNGDQQLSCTNIALIALHQSGETENPVASSVGQEGLFLALPFFRLQLSAQLLLGPERRTRARILYSFFFFSFLSFFSDKMKWDLFIQGRMKSGREISTVVLVLVFGLTGSTLCLSPLRARHVLHQMADLIQVELLRYGERERDTCSLFGAWTVSKGQWWVIYRMYTCQHKHHILETLILHVPTKNS